MESISKTALIMKIIENMMSVNMRSTLPNIIQTDNGIGYLCKMNYGFLFVFLIGKALVLYLDGCTTGAYHQHVAATAADRFIIQIYCNDSITAQLSCFRLHFFQSDFLGFA